MKKASKIPLSIQKEFIDLRPNTNCPSNCVSTAKCLANIGFHRQPRESRWSPLHDHEVQINRLDINEVLLADSESLACFIKFYK